MRFPGEAVAVVQLYKLYSDYIGSTVNFGHPKKRTMTANRLFVIRLTVVIFPEKNGVVLPVQVYIKETSLVISRKNFQGIPLYIQSLNISMHPCTLSLKRRFYEPDRESKMRW